MPDCLTPWAVFNSSGDLSFFAEALHAVGLNGAPRTLHACTTACTLSQKLTLLECCIAEAVDSPYVTATFFAPTNAAFAALLHSFGVTQDQLLADPSMCAPCLQRCVLCTVETAAAA